MKKRNLFRLNNDFVQVFFAVFAFFAILFLVFYEIRILNGIFSINLKGFLKEVFKQKEFLKLFLFGIKILCSVSIVYFLFCLYSFLDGIIGYNCRGFLSNNRKGTVFRFIIKSFEWKIYRLWLVFSGSASILATSFLVGALLLIFFPQFLTIAGINIEVSAFIISTVVFFVISMFVTSCFSAISNWFESDMGFECLCLEPYSKFKKLEAKSIKAMQPHSSKNIGFFVGIAYFLFLGFEVYKLHCCILEMNEKIFFIFATTNVILFAIYKYLRFLLYINAFGYYFDDEAEKRLLERFS